MRSCVEQVLQAKKTARFFVGHKNKAQRKFGGNVVGQHFLGQQQHAYNGLLVVFHPTAIQKVAVAAHLPGVACPCFKIARGHNIGVTKKPQGAAAFAGNARHKVGALAVAHAGVGRINA